MNPAGGEAAQLTSNTAEPRFRRNSADACSLARTGAKSDNA
jgi:hypothetical protein